jgi:predicted amidophosphoribosyltransferase
MKGLSESPVLADLAARWAIRSRNEVSYCGVRSWRAGTKSRAIAAIKAAKAECDARMIAIAAQEMAVAITHLCSPSNATSIVPVAPGHSQSYEANFAAKVAKETARLLGCQYVQAWKARPVSGVSHPKEFSKLGPLAWAQKVTGPVVIVDDIATSGWHLEEAVNSMRASGAGPIFAVAWIAGTVT